MSIISLKNAAILVLAMLCTACATESKYLNTYPQAESPSEVALVKPTMGLLIHSIDGVKYDIETMGDWSSYDYTIAVSPGKHTFVVSYSDGVTYSVRQLSVESGFIKDHKYSLRHEILYGKGEWEVKIIDVTSKEHCWIHNAYIYSAPKDC